MKIPKSKTLPLALLGVLLLPLPLSSMGLKPSQQVVRGPYLQSGTSSSVVVRWRTSLPSKGWLRYGPNTAMLETQIEEAQATTEHELKIENLEASSRTYYVIGEADRELAGGPEYFFDAAPVPGSRVPFRAWLLGDSGTANRDARAVRDAYYKWAGGPRADVWMMLGDNAYNSGLDSEFQRAVFETYPRMLRSNVLWSCIGNHETYNSADPYPYYQIHTFPQNGEAGGLASGTEAYYSFDYANAHFVVLDSMDHNMASRQSPMLKWLAKDLAQTKQEWVIAVFHHGPYTKGSHDSDREIEHIKARAAAIPVLEEGGVDLVLSGHSHSYERSYLIDGHYGYSESFDPLKHCRDHGQCGDGRVDSDGEYEKPSGLSSRQGAVYVVAGSSGKISGGPLDHPAMREFSMNYLGSTILEIDGDRLDLKFLTSSGRLMDYFTLEKGDVRPQPVVSVVSKPKAVPVALVDNFESEDPFELKGRFKGRWTLDMDEMGSQADVERSPGHRWPSHGLQVRGKRVPNRVPDYSYLQLVATLEDADLSTYKGIQFWMKGDFNSYRLALPLANITDHDHYAAYIPHQAGEWTLIQIPWRRFSQAGWGKPVRFDFKQLQGIRIEVLDTGRDFEFKLDDLGLVR